jgi:hypothetical protein
MRVFRAVIQIPALPVFDLGKQLALCYNIASQFVGDDHTRNILKAFQQPAKEPFGRVAVSPSLNKDVEHYAFLIHSTPKIVLYSVDSDEHLVHVPFVSGAWPSASKVAREGLPKLLAPLTDRLIGDDDATFSHEQLNIPQAEAENVIQPDSMTDDLGGKAMAVVWVGRGLHAASFAGLPLNGQPRLT